MQGDALLSDLDALTGLGKLELSRPCEVPQDWLNGNAELLATEIVRHRLLLDHETDEALQCLQLKELSERENRLYKLLSVRAATSVPSTGEIWEKLILEAFEGEWDQPRSVECAAHLGAQRAGKSTRANHHTQDFRFGG